MAPGVNWPKHSEEDLSGLTDGELVGQFHSLNSEMGHLRYSLTDSLDWGSFLDVEQNQSIYEAREAQFLERLRASLEQFPELKQPGERFLRCWALRHLIIVERSRRLSEMLRGARIALGLTQKQVARVAGIHSKLVEEIEQGRPWSPRRDLFERACTEGGFAKGRDTWSRTVWFPLADPRLCRTIRKQEVAPDRLASQGDAVASLALTIFQGRSFGLLPILGDALEEAGCIDAEILTHCRNPGEHARGCWVVDALVRAGRRA